MNVTLEIQRGSAHRTYQILRDATPDTLAHEIEVAVRKARATSIRVQADGSSEWLVAYPM